jgi:hypothetical protein
MPEPAASNPDLVTTIIRPLSFPDGTTPPMPFPSPDRTTPPMPFPSPDGTTPPMPFPSPDGTTPPMPFPSPDRAVPPMPSEVTNGHDRTRRPAGGGMWRTAMMAPRKMMRRTPRGAA